MAFSPSRVEGELFGQVSTTANYSVYIVERKCLGPLLNQAVFRQIVEIASTIGETFASLGRKSMLLFNLEGHDGQGREKDLSVGILIKAKKDFFFLSCILY